MKTTEKQINDSHLNEITALVQGEKGMMSLDEHDVKNVLLGKEGVLYQGFQEEGEDNSSFMKDFFDELQKKEALQACTSMLICVGMSPDNPLMMEDMEIVDDFVSLFESGGVATKWGTKTHLEGSGMSLLVVCTR